MDGWYGGQMGSGWGALMVIMMVLLLAVVAVTVAWWLRQASSPTQSQTPDQGSAARAEQILAERLARGEIETDEYEARRKALAASR